MIRKALFILTIFIGLILSGCVSEQTLVKPNTSQNIMNLPDKQSAWSVEYVVTDRMTGEGFCHVSTPYVENLDKMKVTPVKYIDKMPAMILTSSIRFAYKVGGTLLPYLSTNSELLGGAQKVRMKFGNTIKTINLSPSSGKRESLILGQEQSEFFPELLKNDFVLIEYTLTSSQDEKKVEVYFKHDIRGLQDALKESAQTCKIKN